MSRPLRTKVVDDVVSKQAAVFCVLNVLDPQARPLLEAALTEWGRSGHRTNFSDCSTSSGLIGGVPRYLLGNPKKGVQATDPGMICSPCR
jgi:hypothetical protein